MWARLTESSRRAMFYADDEAKRRGHSAILAEHLLFGILLEPESAASVRLGIELRDQVLAKLAGALDGIRSSPNSEVILWVTGKRVIDEAARIAAAEGHEKTIDTEHFLLAVRSCRDTTASRLLAGIPEKER